MISGVITAADGDLHLFPHRGIGVRLSFFRQPIWSVKNEDLTPFSLIDGHALSIITKGVIMVGIIGEIFARYICLSQEKFTDLLFRSNIIIKDKSIGYRLGTNLASIREANS